MVSYFEIKIKLYVRSFIYVDDLTTESISK